MKLYNISKIKEAMIKLKDGDYTTLDDYWIDFIRTTANTIRTRLESLETNMLQQIKIESRIKAEKFLKGGTIEFPWQVLVASATK